MTSLSARHLIRLQPRPDTLHISQGRCVMATGMDGFILDGVEHGLFVHQTRLLSRYRYLINGDVPRVSAVSTVEQHSMLGYYITLPPGLPPGPPDIGSGQVAPDTRDTLELRISRVVGGGVHEDVDLTNYSQRATTFHLNLEFDADFADQLETRDRRLQYGRITEQWQRVAARSWELTLRYHAEHHFSHPGESGVEELDRGLTICIHDADSPPQRFNHLVTFLVHLPPRGRWHTCVELKPRLGDRMMQPTYGCRAFGELEAEQDRRRQVFLVDATRFSSPDAATLTPVVLQALERAKHDLAALRLYDLDHHERAWTVAAGLPMYVALFGRDTLTASWQAATVSPDLLRGTLLELARWQGRQFNDWRDEQPGRMLHEAHSGPLAMLNIVPRRRYYGSLTTSTFYPVALSELWHWTGDRALVAPLLEPALRSLRWLDDHGDLDGDGFYEYQTRSPLGVLHQGWKDSEDALVHEDGRPVRTPVATCEEQGFAYVAKLHLSELLWWFGEKTLARRFFHDATELKKRFNDRFWLDDLHSFAMGLDHHKEPIRSLGSNAGHCLATGIVDDALVPDVARRLFAEDLFSGWGIRTLSSEHPAYNPYSYHRGSIWPVEQGTFAMGLMRYGLHPQMQLLCRVQFESTTLFPHLRLPELYSGHPRCREHPFPALYPQANSPQAWSASSLFCLLQSLLGIYPYAPLRMLLVDPHLPEWLPEITVEGLRVGEGVATIRFHRDASGHTDYEVVDLQGPLHVLRQPSLWSLTAGPGERVSAALMSLLPGH
ncbi:MAG: glycogen debranching N-terminal domain-containing protein [Myxococcota bacterium]